MSAGPNAERPKSWHNKIVFYRWDKVLVFLFIWTKWFLVLCIHKVSWLYHTALKVVNRQQWCCLCSPAFLCIVVLLVAWPIANVTFSHLKVTLESRVTSQNARLVESKFFIKDCLTLSSLMSISHLFFLRSSGVQTTHFFTPRFTSFQCFSDYITGLIFKSWSESTNISASSPVAFIFKFTANTAPHHKRIILDQILQ